MCAFDTTGSSKERIDALEGSAAARAPRAGAAAWPVQGTARSMRVLLVSFILVAFTRAARADGMVRAAPRVPAIAVATWGDGARAVERIRFAADGVHFRRVRLPSRRSVIDMQVLDDRALVILAADPGRKRWPLLFGSAAIAGVIRFCRAPAG